MKKISKITAFCSAFLLILISLFDIAEVFPNLSGFSVTAEAASKMLNYSSLTIAPGQKVKLKANTKKKVKWSSSDKNVVTVNSKGVVTATTDQYFAGDAKIYAEIGGKRYTCKVTVRWIHLKNAEGDPYPLAISVKKRKTVQLYTDITTGGKWVSVNPYVATVDQSGKVTVLREGTAKIYFCAGKDSDFIVISSVPETTEQLNEYSVNSLDPYDEMLGYLKGKYPDLVNLSDPLPGYNQLETLVRLKDCDEISKYGNQTDYSFHAVSLANEEFTLDWHVDPNFQPSPVFQKGDRYGKFKITDCGTLYTKPTYNGISEPEYVIWSKGLRAKGKMTFDCSIEWVTEGPAAGYWILVGDDVEFVNKNKMPVVCPRNELSAFFTSEQEQLIQRYVKPDSSARFSVSISGYTSSSGHQVPYYASPEVGDLYLDITDIKYLGN